MNAFRRLSRNLMVVTGGVVLSGFILVALVSVVYTPHDPRHDVNLEERYTPPELFGRRGTTSVDATRAHYWLGTDGLGRCILSRTMAGAQVSLRVGVLVVASAIVVGSLMGTVAAYFGRWWDAVLMRVADIMLALPGILLALVIVSILGPSLQHAMVAVAIVFVPQYARVMRAEVLRVKAQEFVTAARALGASDFRILRRAILPNCLAPLLVQATLGMGTAILETAGLSYLGLGDDPSTPEWGRMISDEFRYIRQASWAVIPPLTAISLVVLGFNLLGDGLRDVFDPRLKTARDR